MPFERCDCLVLRAEINSFFFNDRLLHSSITLFFFRVRAIATLVVFFLSWNAGTSLLHQRQCFCFSLKQSLVVGRASICVLTDVRGKSQFSLTRFF